MNRPSAWIGWLVVSASMVAAAQEGAGSKPVRTARVRGRVLDAAGAPVAGAGIAVLPRASWTTAEALKDTATRTAADGRFVLELPEPAAGRPATTCIVTAPNLAAVEVTLPGWSTTETDCGDLQLAEGVVLKGRVRGKDGKPVAGARVEGADLLPVSTGRMAFLTATTTAADGAFELPCALAQAGRLTVTAAGHYTATLAPAVLGEPLLVELTPSGFASGRVLDEQGKPARATLFANFENGMSSTAILVGADGTFRFTLPHRGRYRLSATEATGGRASSDVLAGPSDDIELRTKARAVAGGAVLVRAVDAAAGQPVKSFRAGVRWLRAGMAFPAESITATIAAGADGVARLAGPINENSPEGTLRVLAPGFAPGVLKELEVKEGGPLQLEVKLVKESVLQGKVVDEATGEPVPGATLSAMRVAEEQANPGAVMARAISSSSMPRGTGDATTGPDGSFRIGELGEGTYELTVQCRQRPDVKSGRLKLGGQASLDTVIKMGKGVAIHGRFTGVKPGPRWGVRVEEEGDGGGMAVAMGGGFVTTSTRSPGNEPALTPVAADGSFSLVGLKPGNYALRLSIPGAPRSGPAMDILVDKLRLKQTDLKRDFELAGDGPGLVRGKLTATGAALPRGRFVVLAVVQTQGAGANPFAQMMARAGGAIAGSRRAIVAADGSFALELAGGEYRLEVLDLLSGVVLHREPDATKVTGAAETTKDLSCAVVPLRVSFTPEDYVAASLTVTPESEAPEDPQVARMIVTMNASGRGSGLPSLAESPREVTLFVPPGDVKLTVNTRTSALNERHNVLGVVVRGGAGSGTEDAPLGEAELTAKAGEPAQVTIKVAPAPAIQDGAEKK